MYKRPKTMEELLQASSLKTETILAGGTDLVPLIKNGVKNCSSLIDITQIPELKKIEKTDKGWFIGTAVTLSSLAENPDIRQAYPALSKAAGKTASPQIRSIGTIGGNILQDRRCMYFNQSAYWRSGLPLCFKTGGSVCHQAPASPVCRAIYYSDTAPALCIYGALAVFYENGCRQTLPVLDFIKHHTAENGTVRYKEILLEGFLLPFQEVPMKSAFEKVSIRNSIDFPVIHFAGTYLPAAKQSCLYAGAVSHYPVRLVKTEEAIASSSFAGLDALTEIAVQEIRSLSQLIKEPGISPKIKRESFKNIRFLFEELFG